MLSAQSAVIVRATLPVVGANLDTITETFYASMFADRPELLDGLFNRGNQRNGDQRRALAGAVAAFAGALVARPDVRPDALLSRIAHKHVAVGVTDDQYVIVHKYLFGAIAEVLGDAITPEIAAAWDEVYWLMAGTLIAMEARLYAEAGARDGATWRRWQVVERREETEEVVSLVLRPRGDEPVPPARPGQYVSVRVRMPDGVHQLRQYTLSWDGADGLRRITVKRADEGEVSGLLHATVAEGDELTLSAPFGDVALGEGDAPIVLASAGIGCTPITAMLHHLARTKDTRRVLLLHADRSRAAHALRGDMERLADALPAGKRIFWYEKDGEGQGRDGRMDLEGVDVPKGAVVYLCGPLEFMRSARAQLIRAGVRPKDVHYEVFGPDLLLGVA
ncbi:globin domain-containing protein [Spongiactinospora sp. TRM90649]|uniref:globin domain-containing protein n=1 Tax=Spongiactinospora sp. TRM90649 TaxID=3031114 RepID=UPI0023F99D4C|nr:globin domain-containing protein [Spongiactinospora sp. TRM90649]MDF5753111.1 FAD-binding oxidoreductase [Spongiactinospora sp. TRM90649]